MREPPDGLSSLDRHCTLGLMVAAGLATSCGFAAMGPLTAHGEVAAPSGLPGFASAIAYMAVACASAFAVLRSQGARSSDTTSRTHAPCLLCLLMFAWAIAGALKSSEAFDALWMALQALATAACVLMMTERMALELGGRSIRHIELAMAATIGVLGPVTWWAAGSSGLAGDLRWSAGPQAVALVMTLVGSLHRGGSSPPTHEATTAATCLGVGLLLQWLGALALLDLGPSDAELLLACCAAMSLAVLTRHSQRPLQPSTRLREPVASSSASEISSARQRMAS